MKSKIWKKVTKKKQYKFLKTIHTILIRLILVKRRILLDLYWSFKIRAKMY